MKGVAIVARNRDRLNELALEIQDKCECLVCPCDVSDKSAVVSMARNVLEKFGNIDVLSQQCWIWNSWKGGSCSP